MHIFTFLFVFLFIYSVESFTVNRKKFNRKPDRIHQHDIARGANERNANLATGYWKKWPNGIIPYEINTQIRRNSCFSWAYHYITSLLLAQQFKPLVEFSMNLIQNQTGNCIQFVPYDENVHENWLHILDPNQGCWSWIGMGEGEQWLALTWGCYFQSTIVHELLHTIGFWHEQSRPDRDEYVDINWENILESNYGEFEKRGDSIDTQEMPYDLHSIMHYRYNTFAIDTDQPTIIPKDKTVNVTELGTRDDLSEVDIAKILKYYNCNDKK